jgi:hypothetical protein
MSTFGPADGNAWAGARVIQIMRAIAIVTVCVFKNFPGVSYWIDFVIALAILERRVLSIIRG